MSRVTSKLQVTIPKAIAAQYSITPGDEIEFVPTGNALRVVLGTPERLNSADDTAARLRVLDALLDRYRAGKEARPRDAADPGVDPRVERGWTREDLYEPPRGWRP